MPKDKGLAWENITVGQELPSFSLAIDPTRIVLQVSGTQDFYPVHHDLDFARASGHKDVFVNTGFMEGCFCRLIHGWIGEWGWLRKFTMQMRRMNMPGDNVVFKGKVIRKYKEGEEGLVDCDLWAENQREGVTTTATATLAFPKSQEV